MNTPILLITFNRPKYVKIMLEALKKANVKSLFVFRDGPRPSCKTDYDNCELVKSLIDGIDWGCDVKTNFMQNNLGCGYGPYSAISWAFQFTDKLIILEDDCIPTISFFDFCDNMLSRYYNNSTIRIISGRSQFTTHPIFKEQDYVFTQYAPTWGWATWKRVWDGFDLQDRVIGDFFKKGGFTNQFANKRENRYWNYRYKFRNNPIKDSLHIWDYQFGAFSRVNGAFGIVPKSNLIKYIGVEGTHPVYVESVFAELETADVFSFEKEPKEIMLNTEYEGDYFDRFHGLTLKFVLGGYYSKIKGLFRSNKRFV